MDENIKTVKEKINSTLEDDVLNVKRHLFQEDEVKAWSEYSMEAPSVDEFNSPNWGRGAPIEDTEPEIFTMNQLTPETKEKILNEFQEAAKVAGVKPVEGHPYCGTAYGEDPLCPILNNPDEILVKIQEVFHSDVLELEEEDGVSDKHFILGYIQAKMPKRKIGWKDGSLYVDGARTNVTYQSLAAQVVRKLQKVFGPSKL